MHKVFKLISNYSSLEGNSSPDYKRRNITDVAFKDLLTWAFQNLTTHGHFRHFCVPKMVQKVTKNGHKMDTCPKGQFCIWTFCVQKMFSKKNGQLLTIFFRLADFKTYLVDSIADLADSFSTSCKGYHKKASTRAVNS